MARHFWFAYQRVMELMRAAGAAEKARGDEAWKLKTTAEASGCLAADARWALERAVSPCRGHRLDDAMSRVRGEGFEIPRAGTPLRSFVLLRKLARKNAPFPVARAGRRRASKRKRLPRRSASPASDALDGPG
jgi:hypothetical protein